MGRLTSSEYAKTHGVKAGKQLARERVNRSRTRVPASWNPFGTSTKGHVRSSVNARSVVKQISRPVRPDLRRGSTLNQRFTTPIKWAIKHSGMTPAQAKQHPGYKTLVGQSFDQLDATDQMNILKAFVNTPHVRELGLAAYHSFDQQNNVGKASRDSVYKWASDFTNYKPPSVARDTANVVGKGLADATVAASKAGGKAADWVSSDHSLTGAIPGLNTLPGMKTAGLPTQLDAQARRNLYADATSLAPSTALGVYQIARDTASKGPLYAAKKDVVEPYKQLVQHPLRSFENNPLSTVLMASGAYGALGRGVGLIGRSGLAGITVKEAASQARPSLVDPSRGAIIPRRYSPNVFNKAVQRTVEARTERVHSTAPTMRDLGAKPGPSRKGSIPLRRIDRPIKSLQENVPVPAKGVFTEKPTGIGKLRNQMTEARFTAHQRMLGNTGGESSLVGKRGGRTLGLEAGPLGTGQFQKVGPLVKFADGSKARMPYGTIMHKGKLVDPAGLVLDTPKVVAFREPRVRGLADRRIAQAKSFKVRLVNKTENSLVGLYNRGVLTSRALHNGGLLDELIAEQAKIQAAAKELPVNSNLYMQNQDNLKVVTDAIRHINRKTLNIDYLQKAVRKQAEATKRFDLQMNDAGGMNLESAKRRPLLEAAQVHGIAEYDPGHVNGNPIPTRRALGHKSASADLRKARAELLTARKGKKFPEQKVVDQLTRRLHEAEKKAARSEGSVVAYESMRSQRLLKQVRLLVKRGIKSSDQSVVDYAHQVDAGLQALKANDSHLLSQLMDRAAGERAGGAGKSKHGRIDELIRDRLAVLQRSAKTQSLSDHVARVEGLKGEIRVARVRAKAARSENIRIAKDRVAATSERVQVLQKFANEKMTPRWVRKGNVGGHAPAITDAQIRNALRQKGVDPKDLSYVSNRPGKQGNRNYYQRDTRDSAGYTDKAYTGESTKARASSSTAQDLRDQSVRINVVKKLLQSYDSFMRKAALGPETLKRYFPEYAGKDGLLTEAEATRIQEFAANTKTDLNPNGVHLEIVRAMRGKDLATETDRLQRQMGTSAVLEPHGQVWGGNADYNASLDFFNRVFTGQDATAGTFMQRHTISSGVTGVVGRKVGNTLKPVEGVRNVRLVPSEQLQTFLRQSEVGAPSVPIIGAAFRRAVLPFSIKWLMGNIVEAGVRQALSGSIPFIDLVRSRVDRNFMDTLRATHPDLAAQFEAQAGGGLLYSAAARSTTKSKFGLNANSGEHGKAVQGMYKLTHAAIVPITDRIMGMNASFEHMVKRQVRGKAAQKALQDFTGSWVQGMVAQQHVLDLMFKHWGENPRLAEAQAVQFGKYVDQTLGKYSKFSPEMRNFIQGYAPFIPWYLNSVRFITYTLPVKHPVVTGVLVAAQRALDQDIRDWRAGKGPSHAPPGQLRYGIDTKGDTFSSGVLGALGVKPGAIIDPNRYIPMGAFTGGALETGLNNLVPQLVSVIAIGRGLSPVTFKPLVDDKGDRITSLGMEALLALNSLLESTVPGVAIARRFIEGGKSSADNSTIFAPKTRPNSFDKGAGAKVFGPVPTTYLGGDKANSSSSGKKKGPWKSTVWKNLAGG